MSNVGGVVGLCRGSMENCSNSNEVKSTSGGISVGGVVGALECNTSTKINGNSNSGNVSSNGDNTGGVFGRVYTREPSSSGSFDVQLAGASNDGNVNGAKNVGGVAGSVEGFYYKRYSDVYSLKINVSNCSNTGKIVASGNYAGGVIGYGSNMNSFKENTNVADITGVNWVGGLAGRTDAIVYASGFSNKNTITGYAYIGGVVGECRGISDASNDGNVLSVGSKLEDGVKVSNVGGVVGLCIGSVENCSNLKGINVLSGGFNVGGVGGVVECNTSSKLNGNINVGTVLSNGENTGGVFGKVFAQKPSVGNYEIQLSESKNHGSISGTKGVGGIAGYIEGYEKRENETYGDWCRLKVNLATCSNHGNIVASGDYIGGIVGYGSKMTFMKDSSNEGDVSGVNWVGGFVGKTDAIVYASGFENKNTITGFAYLGGVSGECGGIYDAYNKGNVVSVGSIHEDQDKVANVGGVVGFCRGSVENCGNSSKIDVSSGGSNVGGVAGVVECSTENKLVKNTNMGRISSRGNNTGGVFGRVYAKKPSAGTYEIELSKAGNKGSVTGNKKVGGVVGSIEGCEKLENETYGSWCRLKINVSDCSNTENVIALDDYVGGIVGYGNNMNSFKNSTNIGDITGVNWVGGLVGRIDAVIYANGFANENTITGYSYIGGLAGECKGMIDASNNGDVVSLGSRFENGIKISNVGGVAGFCRGSVVNCHNLIELKTSFEGCNVGGVVGIVECSATSELNGNINLGSVSSNGDNTGGVFGKVYASKPSAGNYEVQLVGANNEGNVSGLNNVGGIAGIIEGCEKLENETYGLWCRLKINVSNCSNAGRVFAFNENQGSIVGFLGSQAEVL